MLFPSAYLSYYSPLLPRVSRYQEEDKIHRKWSFLRPKMLIMIYFPALLSSCCPFSPRLVYISLILFAGVSCPQHIYQRDWAADWYKYLSITLQLLQDLHESEHPPLVSLSPAKSWQFIFNWAHFNCSHKWQLKHRFLCQSFSLDLLCEKYDATWKFWSTFSLLRS